MALLHLIVITVGLLLMKSSSCNGQEVITEPSIILSVGASASVPCTYEDRVFAVSWKKSQLGALAAEEDVVVLDAQSTPNMRIYHMNGFNITDDYSLTIADVSFQDEGRYFCIVSDYATGTLIRGHTD
ncbi:uncharacterized protein [Diadema antillarum]|uniref:uncharacterized protein n=1 Tax=Diadema antillarum TaxID=105358 RepID=UPI003A852140